MTGGRKEEIAGINSDLCDTSILSSGFVNDTGQTNEERVS